MRWFRLCLGLTVIALLIGSSWLSAPANWIVSGVCTVLVAWQIVLIVRDGRRGRSQSSPG